MNLEGKRVYVYRNLHKKCYSVKCLTTNRVILHTNNICLSNVKFRVGKKGREKVIATKQKNVHAGVVGYITNDSLHNANVVVKYNPYKYTSFVKEDGSEIYIASYVSMSDSGIMALE